MPEDPYIAIANKRVPFRIVDLLQLLEIIKNLQNKDTNIIKKSGIV